MVARLSGAFTDRGRRQGEGAQAVADHRAARVGGRADKELVRLAGGGQVADAGLAADEAERVKTGTRVTVEAEDTGKSFEGEVGRITKTKKKQKQKQETEDAEEGAETPYTALIVADGLSSDLRGEEVRVTFHLGGTRGKVLAVPLAAVWSRADGASYVQVQDGGGRIRQVVVGQGASAGGFVELKEVEGRLKEGDLVVVGQERP